MPGNDVSYVSCCLAEKEIPILVKQEPVEIKEPIFEADKFKSRYKKFVPPVPPSPVSRNVLGRDAPAPDTKCLDQK